MSDEGLTLTREDFDALLKKLDKLPGTQPSPNFTDEEVAALKQSMAFTQTFHHDPATLRRMERAFIMAEGFIGVSRTISLFVAFIVVLWTQWDRLMELIAGVGQK